MDKIFENVLLVSDVDGTLATMSDVPEQNKKAIKNFINLGGKFTLASGRNVYNVKMILDEIEVSAPIICFNGGVLYDVNNKKLVSETTIPNTGKDYVNQIIQQFSSVSVAFTQLKTYFYNKYNDFMKTYYNKKIDYYEKIGMYKLIDVDKYNQKSHKIIFLDEISVISKIEKFISKKHFCDVDFVRTSEISLEMIPKGINKGTGVKKVADCLNIKQNNIAVIGDYYNDISMFKMAKYKGAPENSIQDIKEMADIVVCKCTDGAVSEYINYLTKVYKSFKSQGGNY